MRDVSVKKGAEYRFLIARKTENKNRQHIQPETVNQKENIQKSRSVYNIRGIRVCLGI